MDTPSSPQPQAPSQVTPPATPQASVLQPSVPQARIVFYCKDCDKLIDGIKIGKKYVYKCPLCGTKNVAFGTEKSVRSYYHVGG